jgi:phosphoadenosine phosphosulfate reductase
MSAFSPLQLEKLQDLNNQFESATPQEILRWAITTYGDKLTMATAFGLEGCCLLDMIAKIRDEVGIVPDIFNLETGYQFPQTLSLRERLQQRYNIAIRLVQPEETVQQMEARFGGPIYGTNPDQCCHIRKVVPQGKAIQGFDAWISAIRRDQTPERATAAIVGPDPRYDLVKINPLANWTKQQVADYIEANHVPTNPLHEQGFRSIGCWPCTRPVAEHEDDRAGRWAGSVKRECGLHLGRQHRGLKVTTA